MRLRSGGRPCQPVSRVLQDQQGADLARSRVTPHRGAIPVLEAGQFAGESIRDFRAPARPWIHNAGIHGVRNALRVPPGVRVPSPWEQWDPRTFGPIGSRAVAPRVPRAGKPASALRADIGVPFSRADAGCKNALAPRSL